ARGAVAPGAVGRRRGAPPPVRTPPPPGGRALRRRVRPRRRHARARPPPPQRRLRLDRRPAGGVLGRVDGLRGTVRQRRSRAGGRRLAHACAGGRHGGRHRARGATGVTRFGRYLIREIAPLYVSGLAVLLLLLLG